MYKHEVEKLIETYGFWWIASEFEMNEVDILMALHDAHYIDLEELEDEEV